MSDETHIILERDGRRATIRLDRPAVRNAMSFAALQQFKTILDQLEDNPPWVVVLEATPPAFCAGIDLKESMDATPEFAEQRVRLMHTVLAKLRRLPMPVVGKLQGVATGLGCELAISPDIRIAAPDARFSYPEPRVAVPSPAHHLVWLIGLARAQDMLLTARWVDAQEAQTIGLVTRVAEDLDAGVEAEVERILALSPASLRDTKANIWQAITAGAGPASEHHIQGVAAAAYSADRREALLAFKEKREPVFRGDREDPA